MKCPHCLVAIHTHTESKVFAEEKEVILTDGRVPHILWSTIYQRCPACFHGIVLLARNNLSTLGLESFVAYPKASSRPVPIEVLEPYRQDFKEACLVLGDSPKASAALSRRCLQSVLRDKGGAKKKDLADQIDEVIAAGVPSHIGEDLHAVRNIGNFAAHPIKSTNTGEIVDVEPHEAAWNLDVLEALFDFYFVQPALAAKRKADLNMKLKEAGKPELK
jgi:hypothetical protein